MDAVYPRNLESFARCFTDRGTDRPRQVFCLIRSLASGQLIAKNAMAIETEKTGRLQRSSQSTDSSRFARQSAGAPGRSAQSFFFSVNLRVTSLFFSVLKNLLACDPSKSGTAVISTHRGNTIIAPTWCIDHQGHSERGKNQQSGRRRRRPAIIPNDLLEELNQRIIVAGLQSCRRIRTCRVDPSFPACQQDG